MAPSQKNSHSRPWPWGQHHYVDFDDLVKCRVAWLWHSDWVTVAHCKHSCIDIHELDGASCIDIVATRDHLSHRCPFKCDGSFDCNSSTVDDHTNFVCVCVVSCSTDSQVLGVKAQQGARVSGLDGNDLFEHRVSCGVGGVFHLVEEPSSHWHYHRGSDKCCVGGLS